MELPDPTTVEGGYAYLVGSILLVTLVFGVYLLAVYLGVVPGPVKVTGTIVPWVGLGSYS